MVNNFKHLIEETSVRKGQFKWYTGSEWNILCEDTIDNCNHHIQNVLAGNPSIQTIYIDEILLI